MRVLCHPHPALSTLCEPVSKFDDELITLIGSMVETMYAEDGIGLAASQVGLMKRIIVVDPSGGEDTKQLKVMINPRIVVKSKETETLKEGCLSLPGLRVSVKRSVWLDATWQDTNGTEGNVVRLDGLLARIVQHEVDHLDGKTLRDVVGSRQVQP